MREKASIRGIYISAAREMRPVVLNRGRLRGFVLFVTDTMRFMERLMGYDYALTFKELHLSEYRQR